MSDAPEPTPPAADRNLLFGILALQLDFITRDALIQALHAWVLAKAKSLGQILVEHQALGRERHALLEALVQEHLQQHGHDPAQSLAAVSASGSVRQQLQAIADPELHASLAHVAAARPADDDSHPTRLPAEEDSWPTRLPSSVGTPTSAGLRFRILRPHAKGGLGQVSVALDEELHREVALKEIQDKFADDPQLRARFVREAEITGGLEHPGIVPIHGLGADMTGRPYYAMRFIRGDSLKEAIDRFHRQDTAGRDPGERALALRQLLGRFIDVCQAVAYAPSRGVLHRDLKPGNVMLGKYGETLVVDWGLAKPLGQPAGGLPGDEGPLVPVSGSDSAPTQLGQVVGTPAYMSPEQAAGRLDQLGPASDVYSLGATLYCLLTGKAPVEGSDVGEILRKVGRGEFPAPRQVKRAVAPALEAVCLKAMARDPARRYASPRELADEIEHWLADEPVQAYSDSLRARLARWGRRHRTLVTSGVVLLFSAIVALTVGLVLLGQANRRTEEQTGIATAVNDFLQNDLLRQADSRRQSDRHFIPDPNVKVRTLLNRASASIGERFQDRPQVAAAIHQAVGDAYDGIGEYEQAIRHLSAAKDLRTTYLGLDHPDTLTAIHNLAWAHRCAGKTAEAIHLFEQVWERRTQTLGPDHPDTLIVRNNLAWAYHVGGRNAEAIHLLEQLREQRVRRLGPDHRDTLTTLHDLACAYSDAGRTTEAIALLEQVRDQTTKSLGRDHPHTLITLQSLATVYGAARRTADAIALLEQVREQMMTTLGPDHPETLNVVNGLAAAYRDNGRVADAICLLEKLREDVPQKLGPDHPLALTTLGNLADAYQAAGRTSEAIRLNEQVRERRTQTLGPDHPDNLVTLNNLAVGYETAGRIAEAIKLLEQVRERKTQTLGPDHPNTLATMHNLAGAYQAHGRIAEAIQLFEQVRERKIAILGPDHPHTLSTLNNLAGTYLIAGRATEAIKLFEQVRERETQALGLDHPETLTTMHNLAWTYRCAGRTAEAIQLFEQVGEQRRKTLGPDHPHTLSTLNNLASALQEVHRVDQALALYREVLDTQSRKVPRDDASRAGTLSGLGSCLLEAGKPAEAEPVLRECLTIREKKQPEAWNTFTTESMLGGSLLGQKKYAEAEPVLLQGYEGMKQREAKIPAPDKKYLIKSLERLVQLYDAWGKPDQAQQWRKELEQRKSTTPKPVK